MIVKAFFLTENSGPQAGLNLPRSWNPGSQWMLSEQWFGDSAAQVGALVVQAALEFGDVDLVAGQARIQSYARRGAGRLAHREARTGDAGGGLRAVRHRRAPAGDVQVADALLAGTGGHDHPERKVVESPRVTLPPELNGACHVRLDRPAVHADRVGEVCAAEHVVLGELVGPDDAASLADADLRRDVHDVGVLEAGRPVSDEG